LRGSLAAAQYRVCVFLRRAPLVYFLVLTICGLGATSPVYPQQPGQQQPPAPAAAEGTPTIDRIDFQGNRRIRSETLRGRIFSRNGDPYSEEALRRDFHALWNTQYFEDIRLEVQDSPEKPNSKIIIFYVTERPTIRRIEYKGNKSVSESDILDRFKERKVGLSVESQFDPTKIKKAEVVLKDLLAEHGRQFASVKPTYERLPGTNAVKLTFTVNEGPKVKVGKIIIQGNTAFSSRRIIRAMRHSRPTAIPLSFLGTLPIMSKTYDRTKLDEDLEIGVRGLYQDNGYFKVLVKDPVLQTVDINRGGVPGPIPVPLVGAKHGKATNITIGVEEGERYRMGTLHIRSADPDKGLSLKQEYLESIFPIKKGDIFGVDKVRKAIEDYTKLYGNYGFIDFTAVPDTQVNDDTKTIDLTFAFDEQKPYIVRRIEFSGNTGTRDRVIRRELLLSEGDLFRNNLWEVSLLRLNQLDYFDPVKPDAATIKRNVKQGTVDILLKLKEKGRQSISLTGGVSGLAGSYIGLSYQTNNFLGLGETLSLSTQLGTVQRSATFGFTEPYLFDRPISTGFTIFTSRYNFDQSRQTSILLGQQVTINPNFAQNYTQNSTGFTVFASYPLRHLGFSRVGVTYGLTDTSIKSLSNASTALFEVLQFQTIAGPSALAGIRSSRIVPSLTYNSVDSAINPTKGKSFFYSFALEGGPIGGNENSLTNVLDLKYFRPINHKRNVLAFHLSTAFTTGFGGKVVAPYSRFYLGGETDLRGFDIRTVSPVVFIPSASATTIQYSKPGQLDANGNPLLGSVTIPTLSYQVTFPGGDTQGVGNFEYRIPIASHVSASLFFDVGATGALRKDQLQVNATAFSSLAQQFPNANLSPTLPFQPGTNFKLRSSTGIEFVVQLPIVQAPFRVYWAYNLNRMSQVITAPSTRFPADPNNPNDPNWQPYKPPYPQVWDSQVVPQIINIFNNPIKTNFFDPIRTFRFTVSRTF
jgi:outer membrane protein insertion porin family